MPYEPTNPLIVQSDKSLLLEVANPRHAEARDWLARFAELEKSPEHIHTYRITPISLWNAAASGMSAAEMTRALMEYSKFDVPQNVLEEISDAVSRYGLVRMVKVDERLALESDDPLVIDEISRARQVKSLLGERIDPERIAVDPAQRGRIKQALIHLGFPVKDLAGYVAGAALRVALKERTTSGSSFALRDYQQEAVDSFYVGGAAHGGSGVIVLPCGAGKTVVGIGAIGALQCETLILATNVTAVRQWIREILDKTDLSPESVGEYSGDKKEIKPITVATYQILTYRNRRGETFPHFKLFDEKDWGLIIYDEVHLLPAEVFRITADIQARRRLGLTATLVREDGREPDVFTLIGPKKYDMPWKELEEKAWIAEATCFEVRVPMGEATRGDYVVAGDRQKFRIAAENPEKDHLVEAIVAHHGGDRVLVIGAYVSQLERLAERLNAPLITGRTANATRERIFEDFRTGATNVLVVSKVANFAIDLPEANVAVEVSGTFGSRQEEAQRLGRLLRPKPKANQAYFYSLVSRDTRDQEFAAKRQRFLTEQGYRYLLFHADTFVDALSCTEPGAAPMPVDRTVLYEVGS